MDTSVILCLSKKQLKIGRAKSPHHWKLASMLLENLLQPSSWDARIPHTILIAMDTIWAMYDYVLWTWFGGQYWLQHATTKTSPCVRILVFNKPELVVRHGFEVTSYQHDRVVAFWGHWSSRISQVMGPNRRNQYDESNLDHKSIALTGSH